MLRNMLNSLSRPGSLTLIPHNVSCEPHHACPGYLFGSSNCSVYANEDSVGAAIRGSGLSRSELFITTKFSGISSIEDAIQNSLSKVNFTVTVHGIRVMDAHIPCSQLNLKQVDLYLIHGPGFVKDLEQSWGEFERLKHRGLTK